MNRAVASIVAYLLFLLSPRTLPAVTPAAPTPQDPAKSATAFVDVSVVDVTRGVVVPHQSVLVRAGRIETVGPVQDIRLPRDVHQVDGRGLVLMPGLADMHVHLRSPSELISYLAYGVTTVANLGGAVAEAPDILGYKRLIAAGALIGPTIYTTGPLIDASPLIFKDVSVKADSPEEVRQVVGAHKAAGYDMVKIYQRLEPPVYDALITSAREEGICAVGHVPQTITLMHALESGQAMIAHAAFFLEPLLEESGQAYDLEKLAPLIEAMWSHDVTVMPTLVATLRHPELGDNEFDAVYQHPEMRFLHPSVERVWRQTTPQTLGRYVRDPALTNPFVLLLTKQLHETGVLMLLGTDAPAALPGLFPGLSAHMEMAAFVRAGLTPAEVLEIATRSAGEFVTRHIDPHDFFGEIRAGWRADLVLLRRDPLENLEHALDIAGVMARGRWLTSEDLAALRSEMVKQFGSARAGETPPK
ncbi:MAG: amidohydrolase family protein [Planctomycetota bacterium]